MVTLVDPTRDFSEKVGSLESVFSRRARLAIMSCLIAAQELSFLELKQALGLTDGNLSSHLSVLEKKGLVEVAKGFKGKRPHTSVVPTVEGRDAFARYVRALGDLVARIAETNP